MDREQKEMRQKQQDFTKCVKHTAKLMNLKLTPEYLPGVVDNFERIAAIASLVNQFNLPEDIEAAPTFEP
jgi:Asp-tRNA(Asn)/Glu-tRNA(Gln) amidotransferase C subunit